MKVFWGYTTHAPRPRCDHAASEVTAAVAFAARSAVASLEAPAMQLSGQVAPESVAPEASPNWSCLHEMHA